MGIAATFDGYVFGIPKFEEGDYGRYAEIVIRCATAGREVHFVTARFFGKRISVIRDYVNNGDYMTVSGSVISVRPSKRETGAVYCQFFLKDCFFTLPPKAPGTPAFNPRLPSSSLDDEQDSSDDGAQF